MIKQPPYLKKGDKIAIVCPAKKLKDSIAPAIALLEEWGLQVVTGKSVDADYNQFAGDDQLRAADLQYFLDDKDTKAIIAGRGGYGTIRIIDQLDFSNFQENPKWVIGFSDITLLLSHILAVCNVQSIHGQMPSTFKSATAESLETLKNALFGNPLSYKENSQVKNKPGNAEGILIGGNLTLLIAAEGSASAIDYTGKILFLEDVGEHEYAIDRMMRILKRSGKLAGLKGLIIGAFNENGEESIPFGQTPEEVIMEVVKDYNYPVCFNFPVGHIDDNRAMIIGRSAKLTVGNHDSVLAFDQH